MYYGGFTFSEAFNLPISWRRWFVLRINREINKQPAEGQQDELPFSRATHHNMPDVRKMQGQAREDVPSRLRRF